MVNQDIETLAPVTHEDVFYSSREGLRLHAADYGRHDPLTRGPLPVVCLPGLTRNTRDFHDLAVLISRHPKTPRRVVSFDYRGRGQSAWDKDPARYTITTEADDILNGMAALGLEHAIFIGTSRGGLIMHVLAATRPGVMAGGVLNDIGPVIEGAGLAQIKAYLSRTPKPRNWDEAATALSEAHGKSFPALTDADWIDFAHAVFAEKNGALLPDYDPALLEGLKGVDLGTRLPTLWPQFEGLGAMPLLALRGEHSSLLSAETLDLMKARVPSLQTATVKGQGHAPILHLSGIPEILNKFFAVVDKARGH
ncbi:putative hydrolase or acyltransferase (alpha/beta hydrolase superfamily) [Hoeflea phototrophica DFL-43]|uniref:Putative hydrolase or acyltransferase (Alpha/beta hydrolase superfamily) n=1 Tax=Hoeflea phototrophica (strain DSM 17068 / NCIMB 14078 / DFL-43) TaxID=411684 RepID=A9DBG1_HOEPD|nr:alpha/beta hydrolase [Hoeflea phototrophica]EDQ32512.1 putative hydrolase or acyltransferase (alpha/beta hydrolase superfamily) [Hoeflea phototrophica DFL-43]